MMLFVACLSSAFAGQHWWGVGPMLGTMGVPVEYPALMPPLAQDTSGNNLVAPVTFDLRAGAHGVYYIGGGSRIGARLHLAGNFATWGAQEATIEWDWILTKEQRFQVFAGLGAGFGHDRFGAEADSKRPDAYLDVTYFPVRGQVGVLWRDRTRAYEGNLFGTWHFAGDQTFSKTGNAEDEEKGTAVADPFGGDTQKSDAALYLAVGAEVTVYFGNFKNKGGGKDDDQKSKKSKKKKD
jgi:hypothetical protein